MDNSVEFDDISKITRFVENRQRISLSNAHKIIRQFIDGKIAYEYGCYLCLGYYWILPSRLDMLSNLNRFFNKIDFNMRDKVDEKQFFLDMLDFMHDLMFNLAFISDTNREADFNLFFMYHERKMKIPADRAPFDFYNLIEYGEVISEHPGGCFYKILSAIPPKYLSDDKFKQKLKRIADDSLKVLDRADRAHYGRIVPYLSLKIYLYANYDLGSDSDKQSLFDELRSEINAIKYGERIGSWPKKIFFEKQTWYDIAKIFAETKKSNDLDDYCKERNRVLANVLICFQTKDLEEDDFSKLCKILNQGGLVQFVFEMDGSEKSFLPYYVFLPWLKENLFDCKDIVGEYKARFLFNIGQILAGSDFAFDENRVEYILQSLQKLFDQKQLIITDDLQKSNFYRFTQRLLYPSFKSSYIFSLYKQYKTMIQKCLNVDDKYLEDKKKWVLNVIKLESQVYYSHFFEGRAKMLRRKIELHITKEDISEPTLVSKLKTAGQTQLRDRIVYFQNNKSFSTWITSNVIKREKEGKCWIDNGNGTYSNLPEKVEYLDIKDFFDKIDFEKDKLEDEKVFFKDVLDFMHCLMFNIFSVNDSEVGIYFQKRGVNFNSFFMYCSREYPKSYDKKDKRCGMYGKFLNNEPSGYLAKILGAIPKELLADKVIKQKIKEIADDSLKAFDELDAEKCGLIFPYLFLKIYLYKKYDLAASNQDKQILFNELKEELNSIKNGLRKSNWPRNIIFEKQILYDILEYFKDAVDKKEIADVVRSAIIYCHVQDFSEQDFKWYSDNFETDVKNKTEIKVDRDGQPLKNLFLNETDSKIGYYKLKFIVDSNFIIFDKSRLNDEKFKPFSSEEFDIILKKISNEIMFISQNVQDGIFCVFFQMFRTIWKNWFYDMVKTLFKIENKGYLDFLYDKYIWKKEKYRLDLKGCLDAIHDQSRSEYRKYEEELEKKLKENLEKKQIEEGKKNEKNKKYKKEKVEKLYKEEESENEKKDSEKKGTKKESKTRRKNNYKLDNSSDEEEKDKKEKNKKKTKKHKQRKEESSSDSDEESKSDEKERQKVKVKKSYEEEESESQSSESEEEKITAKSKLIRKKKDESENRSYDEENRAKQKTLKTGVLAKAKKSKLNPKREGKSDKTNKKNYPNDINKNGEVLSQLNKNKNESIDQSYADKIKINTEQDNSSNANDNTKIQTNETRISNENAYDQTKENPPSSHDNKNKKLKLIFGIIGIVLFILAFILFFTLALSLAVKIIILLAVLMLSVACCVIVYRIRRPELPKGLNNNDIAKSNNISLNDRQKIKNKNSQYCASVSKSNNIFIDKKSK